MSYDSNTKVALLNEQFSKLLLVALSAGYSQSHRSDVTNLLHNYRGVGSETRYNEITNNLTDAFYLAEVSSVYYDGKRLVFGTYGWYKEVNFHFYPSERLINIVRGGVLFGVEVPDRLYESCYMVKSLADEILGRSKDFKAVPSKNGHKVDRRYK